jgi:hypothetical protein
VAIAIPVFILVVKNIALTELAELLQTPFFLIPLAGTFAAGYVCFFRARINAWLLGLIHFLLAHMVAFLGYFLLALSYATHDAVAMPLDSAFQKAKEATFLSLIGGIWILPGFLLLSWLFRRLSRKGV